MNGSFTNVVNNFDTFTILPWMLQNDLGCAKLLHSSLTFYKHSGYDMYHLCNAISINKFNWSVFVMEIHLCFW